ncbi:MAG: hypothetical protein ACYCZB_17865, partial [Acidiphilium sp.]
GQNLDLAQLRDDLLRLVDPASHPSPPQKACITDGALLGGQTKPLQRIARRAQRLIPFRKFKETRLSRHHHLRRHAAVNQFNRFGTRGFSRRPNASKARAADNAGHG